MDRDDFIVYIKTNDIPEHIADDVETRLDMIQIMNWIDLCLNKKN